MYLTSTLVITTPDKWRKDIMETHFFTHLGLFLDGVDGDVRGTDLLRDAASLVILDVCSPQLRNSKQTHITCMMSFVCTRVAYCHFPVNFDICLIKNRTTRDHIIVFH